MANARSAPHFLNRKRPLHSSRSGYGRKGGLARIVVVSNASARWAASLPASASTSATGAESLSPFASGTILKSSHVPLSYLVG